MNSRQSFYEGLFQAQVPRFLGLLDRQPFSPSYGCFDRRYWLHRTSDFPSAATQMGVETLGHLIKQTPMESSSHATLVSWFRAAFEFTLSIQNRDGSFDEWYPGEHGWAGPTGYILYSLFRADQLAGEYLSTQTQERFRVCCRRAGTFLSLYEESDVLANHQAMGLLALAAIAKKLGSREFEAGEKLLWSRFESSFSKEGWSKEYDGPDPGYQTATLSFLARLHRLTLDPRIEALIPSQLEFLSHFFYPDGGFAGLVGSRGTKNIFVFGLEYWANQFPLAERLAQAARRSLENGFAPRPQDQEDHYLLYRLPEFCEAALQPNRPSSSTEQKLAFERSPFEVYWPESGYWIKRSNQHYWVANLHRGGGYLQFDLRGEKCIAASSGLAIATKNKIFTSNWADQDRIIEQGSAKTTSGRLSQLKQPLFTPLKLIAFRLVFLALSRWPAPAKILKSWIRRQLMVGKNRSSFRHRRTFKIEAKGLVITDEIENPGRKSLTKVWWEGDFLTRLVPQSRYFSRSDFDSTCTEEILKHRGRLERSTTLPWDI